MYIFKIFIFMVLVAVLNKVLNLIKNVMNKQFKIKNVMSSIISRRDLIDFGMDYYLILCKYIISQKNLSSNEVHIQDITGKEIVDIKFKNKDNEEIYVSCMLKDTLESEEFENVTYDDVIDLLSFMIKDNINKGMIFTNSYFENDALEFIENLNKNSSTYSIDLIDGYEIIKFARKRNEKIREEEVCA